MTSTLCTMWWSIAANQIMWERMKFDIVQKCHKFLLEIVILYHQQIPWVLLSSSQGKKTLGLTLGELHVLMYPRCWKPFWVALGFKLSVTCCVFWFFRSCYKKLITSAINVHYIPTHAQISSVNLYYNYSDMFQC